MVHEHVLTAVVRGDKAEAFVVVEELNGAGLRHGFLEGGKWYEIVLENGDWLFGVED